MDKLGGFTPVQARLFNGTALPARRASSFLRESQLARCDQLSVNRCVRLMSPDALAVARSLSRHFAS